MTSFDDIVARADKLVQDHTARVQMQIQMEKLYRLETVDEGKLPDWIKTTRDPQPHEAIEWTADVLSINEPSITVEVPREQMEEEGGINGISGEFGVGNSGILGGNGNGPVGIGLGMAPSPLTGEQLSDTMENVVRATFRHNDQRRKFNLQRDLIKSGFLYGESVAKIADLRADKKGWQKSGLDKLGRSPFAVKACNPTQVYDEWDAFGLSAVLHRYTRSLREVQAVYPDAGDLVKVEADKNGYVVFCEWWTRDELARWVERTEQLPVTRLDEMVQNQAILTQPGKNSLGFIPFVVKGAYGSGLFDEYDKQLYPLLYAGWKSKLFYRANLFLTVASTLAFSLANPQFFYSTASGDKAFQLDFTGPNVYPIQAGEQVTPLQVQLNKDLYEVLQLIMQKQDEATVSKVIAGQQPGGVTAAAAINLLIQGGKLRVFPVQMAVGELYAQMVQMLFDYIRNGDEVKLFINRGMQPITADMLPDVFDVRVELKADLPQDKLAMIQAALQAWRAQLISRDTAWEWIGVEDKVKEQEKIDREVGEQMAAQQPMAPPPGMPGPTAEGQPPMLPSGAVPPNVAQGMLPNPNPQVPEANAATMANAMLGAGGPPPMP